MLDHHTGHCEVRVLRGMLSDSVHEAGGVGGERGRGAATRRAVVGTVRVVLEMVWLERPREHVRVHQSARRERWVVVVVVVRAVVFWVGRPVAGEMWSVL